MSQLGYVIAPKGSFGKAIAEKSSEKRRMDDTLNTDTSETDAQASMELPNSIHSQHQTRYQMSAEEEAGVTADPIVNILAAFDFLPSDYHADLFNDFQDAAQSHDLRRLLDTISDWAATAELYSHSGLAADLQEAIGKRKGVADWLHG